MSYQVLARKWRPKSFSELMGQEHVVTVLVNALTQQRLHHAYLFTGTRGVGKTTIARIFAKSLNCEQGITATPCGTCDACVDIDAGRFVDLLEIDAASKTKVDDTREILDNVQYAPTRGRYKVYLIDEVHMLSRSSFNALLKTLEEPPEHVKFILATTDPQKLPVTVLSRCLQFHLKALTINQISEKISEILTAEAINVDTDAIALLAKAARGSMRDCLSLTDQSIAQGNGAISRNDVQQMLGGVDRDWVYKIVIALLKNDAKGLMHLSLEIASYAPSYSRLSAELLQLLHQIAMAQVVDTNFALSTEYQSMLTHFCQLMSAEDIQLYYQIVLTARKDLPYADDEQAAFDMMLLRLLAFKPIVNSQELVNSDRNETLPNSDALNDNAAAKAFEKLPFSSDKVNNNTVHKENSHEAKTHETNSEHNTTVQSTELPITSREDSVLADNIENVQSQTVAQVLDQNSSPLITQALAEVSGNNQQNNLTSHTAEMTNVSEIDHVSEIRNPSTVEEGNSIAELNNEILAIEQQAQVLSEQPTAPDKNEERIRQADNTAIMNQTPTNDETTDHSQQQASVESPVAAAIATRNMLRSRKKSLEDGEKKSNGASVRPTSATLDNVKADTKDNADSINQAGSDLKSEATSLVSKETIDNPHHNQVSVPDLATLPEQPYHQDIIDPKTIKLANQVDKWAHMIDSMSLAARLRQLAIHATIDESSTDEILVLQLDQSIKHLNSDAAHKQLEQRISEYLQRKVTVELNIVEKTVADPYQIQTDINSKRYEYAQQVLKEDNIVIALQEQFQAKIDQESIVAR